MMRFASVFCGMTLAVGLWGTGAWAQATTVPSGGDNPAPSKTVAGDSEKANRSSVLFGTTCVNNIETFYLSNVSQINDGNEIQTAVRNLLPPTVKIYLVPSQNALLVCGGHDDLALAQKIIRDLDRPKKTYRLTYTMTEMDGGKRVGTQHFAMIVVGGQRTVLKQGSKVPVATGTYNAGASTAGTQTQFTYLDIGMNFDATLTEIAGGAMLKSKVEQSAVTEDKTISGVNEPVIRQTSLEGTSMLTLGKPMVLGSVDVPGSTRHTDVEVVMEEVK
jgi:type II secretory pathway component GspD/PulD (secretin)